MDQLHLMPHLHHTFYLVDHLGFHVQQYTCTLQFHQSWSHPQQCSSVHLQYPELDILQLKGNIIGVRFIFVDFIDV